MLRAHNIHILKSSINIFKHRKQNIPYIPYLSIQSTPVCLILVVKKLLSMSRQDRSTPNHKKSVYPIFNS